MCIRDSVWAPWYTLHKLMAGLLDVHQLCGNTQALDVLVNNAAWVKLRVDGLTPQQMQASLEAEFGGMNEVLANLHGVTRDPEHLRLAQAFDHRRDQLLMLRIARNGGEMVERLKSVPPELRVIAPFDAHPVCRGRQQRPVGLDFVQRGNAVPGADDLRHLSLIHI